MPPGLPVAAAVAAEAALAQPEAVATMPALSPTGRQGALSHIHAGGDFRPVHDADAVWVSKESHDRPKRCRAPLDGSVRP